MTRTVLSIFALIALAIAAPIAAHARAVDHASVPMAYDDDPGVTATFDSHDVPTVVVIRSYVLVELEPEHRALDFFALLSFAPKTSPPGW